MYSPAHCQPVEWRFMRKRTSHATWSVTSSCSPFRCFSHSQTHTRWWRRVRGTPPHRPHAVQTAQQPFVPRKHSKRTSTMCCVCVVCAVCACARAVCVCCACLTVRVVRLSTGHGLPPPFSGLTGQWVKREMYPLNSSSFSRFPPCCGVPLCLSVSSSPSLTLALRRSPQVNQDGHPRMASVTTGKSAVAAAHATSPH